jgi:hypothetical protein
MSTANDTVGYGKPPQKHQFKPGQSGNPNGRPKGSKNLATILKEELDQKIPVTEGGIRRQVSKRRLAVRQQVNKAAQGDPKAFIAITKLQQSAEPGALPMAGGVEPLRTELTEEQCMAALSRFRKPTAKETEA